MTQSTSKPHLIRNETTITAALHPPTETTPPETRLEWGSTGSEIRAVKLRPSLVNPSTGLEIVFEVGEMELNTVTDQHWVTYQLSERRFQDGLEKAADTPDTQTYLRLEYLLINAHTHSLPVDTDTNWFTDDFSVSVSDAIVVDDRQLIPISSDAIL